MSVVHELIKTVTASGKKSQRSQQIQIGPSELGGCRKKIWLKLNGQETVNHNTLSLASIMGTAIHTYLYEVFKAQDPHELRFLLEHEFEFDGIKGHVDMYDSEECEVIDWKTTKKSGLSYFPSLGQRWQVQVYGYLIAKNGYPVKNVTLVAIPRDGNENDIVFHTEPYDEAIALEALVNLEEIKAMDTAPPAEKNVYFCKDYCGYYDPTGESGCASLPKQEAEGVLIENDEASSAANTYLQVSSQIDQLSKIKESLREMLEGTSGITKDGIKVSWSETAGRKSIDQEYVGYFFEKHGEAVPMKMGNPSMRLTVKQC